MILSKAWQKVKYQEGDKIYDTVEEATKDLAKGFNVVPVKQPETMMERLQKAFIKLAEKSDKWKVVLELCTSKSSCKPFEEMIHPNPRTVHCPCLVA